MASPVAGLDKTDCRILARLNSGRDMPRPVQKNRMEKLIKSGFVEEKGFGEVVITLRGQLELARWRYRKLPKPQYVIMGPTPRGNVLERFFKST